VAIDVVVSIDAICVHLAHCLPWHVIYAVVSLDALSHPALGKVNRGTCFIDTLSSNSIKGHNFIRWALVDP
jgi:hypothetical protein